MGEGNVHLGKWTAMSIAQDGFGLPIFSSSVFSYFITGDISAEVFVNEVPHPGVRQCISDVRLKVDYT